MDFQELILSLRTQTIYPELILLLSLLLTVFLDLILEKSDSGLGNSYQWIPFIGLLASFIALLVQWNEALHPTNSDFFKEENIAFLGSIQGDIIGILFRAFIAISGFFLYFYVQNILKNQEQRKLNFIVYS